MFPNFSYHEIYLGEPHDLLKTQTSRPVQIYWIRKVKNEELGLFYFKQLPGVNFMIKLVGRNSGKKWVAF